MRTPRVEPAGLESLGRPQWTELARVEVERSGRLLRTVVSLVLVVAGVQPVRDEVRDLRRLAVVEHARQLLIDARRAVVDDNAVSFGPIDDDGVPEPNL